MPVLEKLNYDVLAPEIMQDPYPLYAHLREVGPHWNERLGGWCLMNWDHVSKALVDSDLLAARFDSYLERAKSKPVPDPDEIELYEGLCLWFNYTDPPLHTKLRSLTQKVVMRPMTLAKPETERLTDECLDAAETKGELEIVSELARPVALGTVVSIMGVPPKEYPLFTKWSAMLATFIGGELGVTDRREQALTAQRAMRDYFSEKIAEARANPTGDYFSNMLEAEHPTLGRFTDEEIIATSAMMMFAGHGTTTHLIGNMFLSLLRHPEQIELIRANPKLIMAAVDETLRWDSPVHIQVRIAGQDGVANLPEAKKGDRVFLFMASANRDPVNGRNYENFDISRTDCKHMTFGLGPHACLGAALARVEASVVLTRFFERFDRIELVSPLADLRWEDAVGFRSLKQLRVRVS